MLTTAVIQYSLQAANDLSVNWNWSWLTVSQGGLCDIALMRIERDETARAYYDEITDEYTSIKAWRVVLF